MSNLKYQKLLSHRMRGYASIEHSQRAFRRVGEFPVTYFEVDTRVSKDGEIFIYHDSWFKDQDGEKYRFQELNGDEVRLLRYSNGESIATLEGALKDFKKYSNPGQRFCIDIKDYGFEENHLDLLRSIGIEDEVIFVSWIPQALIRLANLGALTPLILSHWNLLGLGRIGATIAYLARSMFVEFGPFVLMGDKEVTRPLGELSTGYQHALIAASLPPDLVQLLVDSGGGICVHTSVVKPDLIDYCSHHGLSLWIFSIDDLAGYERYANQPGIDVIFCDDAPNVASALRQSQG